MDFIAKKRVYPRLDFDEETFTQNDDVERRNILCWTATDQ
jgi:hypothetical protein